MARQAGGSLTVMNTRREPPGRDEVVTRVVRRARQLRHARGGRAGKGGGWRRVLLWPYAANAVQKGSGCTILIACAKSALDLTSHLRTQTVTAVGLLIGSHDRIDIVMDSSLFFRT